ncbi:MAG: site-specific DNA-methyltransferase [Chloroflexi bacterium]|nr:site-specific DNA-methyltransferase [Chloroflexota bacterium]
MARELLTESGSVFVQIGDENVHLARSVMDEILGSENFVSVITIQKTTSAGGGQTEENAFQNVSDFVIWYAKSKDNLKYRPLYTEKTLGQEGALNYNWVCWQDGTKKRIPDDAVEKVSVELGVKLFRHDNLTSSSGVDKTRYEVTFEGRKFTPHPSVWKTGETGMQKLLCSDRLIAPANTLRYVRYFNDFPVNIITNVWTDMTGGVPDKVYVVQTNAKIVSRCLLMTTDPGDLVLDPTCGSGTTAYVAEQWGRRWITIDTSRVAIALARTRLMAGRFPYYKLADTHTQTPGVSETPGVWGEPGGDIKKGFIYKRVPHITLKSIANNEEIDAIHARWQEQLEPLRAQINASCSPLSPGEEPGVKANSPLPLGAGPGVREWQEWEMPRELPPTPEDPRGLGDPWGLVKGLLAEWWNLRRQRQKEIDASIARRADTEQLYDQPYEDNKRIRVTGPFTVESLSPHRVLSTDEERPESEITGHQQPGAGQFEAMILDNLRAAGVQNTVKNERLKFTRLEPYAGMWLHAVGEVASETPGVLETPGVSEGIRVRRVAVSIGPEHGTVGPDQIKDAAKEAVQGIGFDLLVVLGFAFDPHVSEEIKRYGKLTVLPARINPDLQMGGELLKRTGYGNLFMVFGEPDLTIQNLPDGKMTVTIKGVDVYDPTTGEIRSSSTDDIACWFVDTNYNGESFFVRHAYFTGADEPYEKLKRALRAEIDEAAWSALYSTTSYPFEKPETGKIAVKVINHYGDEVLKVYPL